ncbi:HD-GYP domain-containing protein [Methylobacterium sp. Leaf100]|uniref:HD-GYP domain-containing protein n=1 Tax=Methylobacterium sp. Leaf100 TaxID=1736252 RepID=UPI000B1E2425|nr:HD-GYP domain-containing protein [Methylobacterium sp. Leaf100]
MPLTVIDPAAPPVVDPGSMRLSELLGALSHALDLTEGQPVGHCVRACWIGVHVGRTMGLPNLQLWELYYAILLKDLGCSSNAARICQLYLADDLTFKHDFKTVSDRLPQVLGFVFSHTGLKAGLADRFRAILNILQNGGEIAQELIETRCQRGAEIARQMRFPEAVCGGILALDEHWNGQGKPNKLEGPAIPLYARIALLAQIVDVFHRSAGRDAAMAEIRSRTGTWFDPQVVAAFERVAGSDAFWTVLASDNVEDAVFALEPAQRQIVVDADYLDDIARAFAQIIDSKSPFTSGHSERVAVYADLIAEELGFEAERRRWLKRAALLHDIGKLGVSNAILDKNGKLDDVEWVAMRNHAALSENILGRVIAFRDMARIGGGHHERLDGKGYPRGLAAEAICIETRIVSVSDVFDALTANRPYRAAMPIPKALGIMRAEVGASFDPNCFAALERALSKLDALANAA